MMYLKIARSDCSSECSWRRISEGVESGERKDQRKNRSPGHIGPLSFE